jgi:required for meiotic nuclear division protein 1
MKFKAFSVANEIDLNSIAHATGIRKKYTWEEPLILQGKNLAVVAGRHSGDDEAVFLFSFGCVVFMNYTAKNMGPFLESLSKMVPGLDHVDFAVYTDDYEIRKGRAKEPIFRDDYTEVANQEAFHAELVAITLAKSVALEKNEKHLGKILDTLETMIDRLESGKLRVSDRELARTTARIVRHEYNSLAYIMILDKPDITWSNGEAETFYSRMSDFFELNDRYEILKQKTQILNDIIGGFTTISHSLRGLVVEWIIIILIVAEVVLMVIDLLHR